MGEHAQDAINASLDDWMYEDDDGEFTGHRGFHKRPRRGTPAPPGSPLAAARMAAHSAFDPIWQKGEMTRSGAYRWLARQLDLPTHLCHMILFDEAMCQRVRDVCLARDFAKIFHREGRDLL